MGRTKYINEIKVGDNVTTFGDSTLFIGVENKKKRYSLDDYSLDHVGFKWSYKVSYCSNDYVILSMARDVGSRALYILCNYSSIRMTDECNK